MSAQLSKLSLSGFRTIRELDDFEPGSLTILIGPNGAGKSNVISFFRLLSWMTTPPGNLQFHVGLLGGASAILRDGPAVTREICAELTLVTDAGANDYSFRLFHAAGDTFVFADERYRFSYHGAPAPARWVNLDAGHREARIIQEAEGGNRTAGTILGLLRRMIVHQFHDTSATARVRSKWPVDDNRYLKEDAANLAPFLHRLREERPKSYQRIVETIRLILPFFADFDLDAENGRMILRWRERGCDQVFSAAQAADGMLRAMALVALLQQPEENLPNVLILDEPELGLHPYAINVIAGLLRSVSLHTQVIVATQSVALIDHFRPEETVVVERQGRESILRRLSSDSLSEWLEGYTLSELWEKNVIGGRPR